MIYTVTMNPAVDYTLRTKRIVPGEVNRINSAAFHWGGKGINVSVILHRLGLDTVATGFIAGFTGKALEEGVRNTGVAADFVSLPAGTTRINVKIKTGQETDLNTPGPEIPANSMRELEQKLHCAGNGDTVCFCGNIPDSVSQDQWDHLLRQIKEHGARLVADLTGERLCTALRHGPFLVKPNRAELADFAGRTAQNEDQLTEDARQLQQLGAKNVLVSLGADGALLLDETGAAHRIGVPEGTVVDSVGAGDSMVAGFLAGWEQNRDFSFALRLAAAAGSATAYSDKLATKEEILRLMEEP